MELRSRQALVDLLASSLGEDSAIQTVTAALRDCGLGEHLTTTEALGVLRRIESMGGHAALAARVALSRFERSESDVQREHRSSLRPPAELVPIADVQAQIALAVGADRAASYVHQACAALGIVTHAVSPAEAIAILEAIEKSQPSAAVATRFAKVKFMLR